MTPPEVSLLSFPLKLYIWPVNHPTHPSYFVVAATNLDDALLHLKQEAQKTYGNTDGYRLYCWCAKGTVVVMEPKDGTVIELKGIAE